MTADQITAEEIALLKELCEKATPETLEDFISQHVSDARKDVRIRAEAAKVWASGTNAEWNEAVKLHGGEGLSKKERLKVAARQQRITIKCQRRLQMFEAVLERLTLCRSLVPKLIEKVERERVLIGEARDVLIEIAAHGNCDCDLPSICIVCEASKVCAKLDEHLNGQPIDAASTQSKGGE